MYVELSGCFGEIQVIFKESADDRQRLTVDRIKRLITEDFFDEHLANRDRELVDQTPDTKGTISEYSTFSIKDLTDFECCACFFICTGKFTEIVGGIVAVVMGLLVKKIRIFFPPLITGTVVFTIGLSLYPTAINYMAGGTSNPDYGSWQNWAIAFFTLIVVTALNHFGKGIWKLASILIGIIVGYLVSIPFGMVDFSSVGEAGVCQLPSLMHFGVQFEPSSCVALGILFAINSIQAIGDYSATTIGAMDRTPKDEELQRGIVGYGISNVVGALLGGLPTATYSQNVGIVTTTKVINRWVLGLAAAILGIAGLVPKFSAILTTIPQCVLGGATVSVFASIAMTGMKLVASAEMDYRNSSIVGLAAALGMGVSQATAALASFPTWVTTIFGKSPVVLATIIAVLLNIILPKIRDEEKVEAKKKIEIEHKLEEDHKEFGE